MNSTRKWTFRLLSGVIYALPVLLIALAMTAAAPPPGVFGYYNRLNCDCDGEREPLPVVVPPPDPS